MKICAFLFLAFSAVAVNAQTITAHQTTLNYNYVFGAGGDSNVGDDEVIDTNLAFTDSEHLEYSGFTSGTLPGGTPYTAGVDTELDTSYLITGSLSSFEEISVEGRSWGRATGTGAGIGLMISANPGNQTIFNFSVAGSMDYRLQGQISGDEVGVGHLVALQRWDGIVWQQVFTSWSLPGLQGSFDVNGTLNAGDYRMLSHIAFKADTNETWNNSYNYTLTAVPEPITALGLLPALWFMRRRRR